jgi:hypothetical protein
MPNDRCRDKPTGHAIPLLLRKKLLKISPTVRSSYLEAGPAREFSQKLLRTFNDDGTVIRLDGKARKPTAAFPFDKEKQAKKLATLDGSGFHIQGDDMQIHAKPIGVLLNRFQEGSRQKFAA